MSAFFQHRVGSILCKCAPSHFEAKLICLTLRRMTFSFSRNSCCSTPERKCKCDSTVLSRLAPPPAFSEGHMPAVSLTSVHLTAVQIEFHSAGKTVAQEGTPVAATV